jgi:hypothetical protein
MEIARAALSGGRIAFEGNLPWHNVSSAKNSCNSDVGDFPIIQLSAGTVTFNRVGKEVQIFVFDLVVRRPQ